MVVDEALASAALDSLTASIAIRLAIMSPSSMTPSSPSQVGDCLTLHPLSLEWKTIEFKEKRQWDV